MSGLRTAVSRIVALFIDDWPTTVALAAWLVVATALLPRLRASLAGTTLYVGLALILVSSVAFAARVRAR